MWAKGFLVCLILAYININFVQAFVCIPDFCATVSCAEINCDPNEIKKLGGFCNCCHQCFTILGENQTCEIRLRRIIRGAPPLTIQCDEGLICLEGVCQKLIQLQRV